MPAIEWRLSARALVVLFLALVTAFALPAAAFAAKPAPKAKGDRPATAACGPSAHPSGKDRCDEPGGSGTQGRSASDPDDDGRGPDRSNGGADKPGGPGGVNPADQDGNNGCGNDQDFEDDNEGWCGAKPKN